ncbi:hypothetical protein SEA_BOLT007_64 [Arthrobacter phage Bolt007]|uniref:Uncharacterized protein n=1 Tax=Arthrobacter phage Bolt007 TaxID=3017297 RepID=A0AA49I6E7_9CAUD|nr:hypothetical protein SEA_BOLT007_64 [Arthrobacter phage Bolt007]
MTRCRHCGQPIEDLPEDPGGYTHCGGGRDCPRIGCRATPNMPKDDYE